MNTKKTTIMILALSLSACATPPRGDSYYRPLIDLQGKDPARVALDIGECQDYARQTMDAASGAVAGAIAGALLGAMIAPRGYRNELAVRGIGAGAVAGAAKANDTQESIIKRCMVGRGYSVLN
jgi:outer membrane lipoprotein SlyB